jgi:pyocin large subunit-like protein
LPSYGDIEGNFYITNGEYFSVSDRGEPKSEEQTSTDTTPNIKSTKKTKPTKTTAVTETETTTFDDYSENTYVEYHFRSKKLLEQHFEKHGGEFSKDFDKSYSTAAEYEKGASDVINNSEALHKTEAEDGDGVYYIEDTNEFVILSKDGYIRTYFRPNGGKKYYDRQ